MILTFWRKISHFGETWGSAFEDLGSLSSYNHFWPKERDQHCKAMESNCHNGTAGVTQAQ